MSASFNDLASTKLGKAGERMVDEHMARRAVDGYEPTRKDKKHKFDRIFAMRRGLTVVEVKTKTKRLFYPDTGYPLTCHEKYLEAAKSNPVKVVWVDWEEGLVYGADLLDLLKPRNVDHYGKALHYPLMQAGVIYFPRACMEPWFPLTAEQIAELKQLSDDVRDAA